MSHTTIVNGQRIRFQRIHARYNTLKAFFSVSLLNTEAPTQVVVRPTEETAITLRRITELTDEESVPALAAATENTYYYNLFL